MLTTSRGCSVPWTEGAIPGDGKALRDEGEAMESWQRWFPCLELGATAREVHWPSEPLLNIQHWFCMRHPRQCAQLSLSCLLASWGICSIFSVLKSHITLHPCHLHFPFPLKCGNPCFCALTLISVQLPKATLEHTLFHLTALNFACSHTTTCSQIT